MLVRGMPSGSALKRLIATCCFLFAGTIAIPPVLAAPPVVVSVPGAAFSVTGKLAQVVVEDTAEGRVFRGTAGTAGATLTLSTELQLPPRGAAEPRIERLVVYFHSTVNGRNDDYPRLRSLELRSRSGLLLQRKTDSGGDFRTNAVQDRNAWVFEKPISVSEGFVVRLQVAFAGGFEGNSHPGEFQLNRVALDFQRKALILPTDKTTIDTARSSYRQSDPSALPATSSGVIYALTNGEELDWYRHDGRDDGTFKWALPEAKKIGNGWHFKQLFSGGDGVIYAINDNNALLWYRHDGRDDGTFKWAAAQGRPIASGWNFRQVFSAGDGIIYAVTSNHDLLWFRHDGRTDGSPTWAAPKGKKVAAGWNFKQVFSGGNGIIYAIGQNNDLLWFRHDGRTDGTATWTAPEGKKIASGWDYRQVFGATGGAIYAINGNHDLLWFRHDGRSDGSATWAAPTGKKVGSGWELRNLFSGETLHSN